MKKLIPFIFAIILFASCEENITPVTISVNTVLSETVEVNLPQTTQGNVHAFDESTTVQLGDYISNIGDVTDITINSLSYTYKMFAGNTAAVINSATLVVNGVTIATINNVNPATETNSNTTIVIDDANVISEIKKILLNNASATIQISGSATSEEGTANFVLETDIDLTAEF